MPQPPFRILPFVVLSAAASVVGACSSSATSVVMNTTPAELELPEASTASEPPAITSVDDLHQHLDFAVHGDGLQGAQVAEVPVEVSRGWWLVPVTFASEGPVTMILDTGAPTIVASRLLPEGVDWLMPLAKGVETTDLQGVTQNRDVHLLGGLVVGENALFNNVVVAEGWVEEPHPFLCFSDAGLLGNSLTHFGAWQFDPSVPVIRIASRSEDLPLEGYRVFPLEERPDGEMAMQVVVEGRELPVFLDTGYNGDIALAASIFEELFPDAEEHPAGSLSVNGPAQTERESETSRSVVRLVRLGSANGIPLEVEVESEASELSLIGARALSALGGVAWERSERRLFLKAGEPTQATNDAAESITVHRAEDGRLAITAVAVPGNTGTAARFREGDIILEIDGVDATRPNFSTMCQLLRHPQRIVVQRGGERIEIERPDP